MSNWKERVQGQNNRGYSSTNGSYKKNTNQQTSKTNQSIGSIYINKSKTTGEEYFNITIGDKKYIAYINKFKKSDNHPDFRIFEKDSLNANDNTNGKSWEKKNETVSREVQQNGGYTPTYNDSCGTNSDFENDDFEF